MPTVGFGPRASGIVVGTTLVILGLGMALTGPTPGPVSAEGATGTVAVLVNDQPVNDKVDFTIHDDLGSGQTRDIVTVFIDGVGRKNLVITDASPYDQITVTAPPGTCSVDLTVHSEWSDVSACDGSGYSEITALGGEDFGLCLDEESDLSLVSE